MILTHSKSLWTPWSTPLVPSFLDIAWAMAHLKKSSSGHRIRTSSGHLSKGCATREIGVNCNYCPPDRTPRQVMLTIAGNSPQNCGYMLTVNTTFVSVADINGSYILTQQASNPCFYRGGSFSWASFDRPCVPSGSGTGTFIFFPVFGGWAVGPQTDSGLIAYPGAIGEWECPDGIFSADFGAPNNTYSSGGTATVVAI